MRRGGSRRISPSCRSCCTAPPSLISIRLRDSAAKAITSACRGGTAKNYREFVMPLILDKAAFQNSLASLPLVTYLPGETVIVDGSTTDRLLILKKGNVAIVKGDTEIAKVAEPGAVFGELSVLLNQPHTADVRALETSQFHIANATALFEQNPMAVLHVATVLAHRLDGANRALIQLKHQLSTGAPHSVIAKTVIKMERLFAVGGAKEKVANSGEYKFQVADQKQDPTSLRLAYHLAVSLF